MLLRSAGIEPFTHSPGVGEDVVAAEAARALGVPLTPAQVVELLARAKAEAVLEATGARGLVLGGDSMFVLDGAIYGKPHTPSVARERWELQRGRTGSLFSGHWLIDTTDAGHPKAVGAVAVAQVTFADDISDDELDAYISTGEPLFVAGAFTIDSLGAPFITHIDGDPSTVVGLSLPTLRRLVRSLGHEWTALWNRPRA